MQDADNHTTALTKARLFQFASHQPVAFGKRDGQHVKILRCLFVRHHNGLIQQFAQLLQLRRAAHGQQAVVRIEPEAAGGNRDAVRAALHLDDVGAGGLADGKFLEHPPDKVGIRGKLDGLDMHVVAGHLLPDGGGDGRTLPLIFFLFVQVAQEALLHDGVVVHHPSGGDNQEESGQNDQDQRPAGQLKMAGDQGDDKRYGDKGAGNQQPGDRPGIAPFFTQKPAGGRTDIVGIDGQAKEERRHHRQRDAHLDEVLQEVALAGKEPLYERCQVEFGANQYGQQDHAVE